MTTVKELERRVAALERRLREVESKEKPSTPYEPFRPLVVGAWAECPACRLDLTKPMGYVCPRSGCPTGLGSRGTMLTDAEYEIVS